MRPVQAQPGYTVPDVLALFTSKKPFVYADCFTFELLDGTKLYYTAAQQDLDVIPLDGTLIARLFKAGDIKVSGLKMKLEIGVSVDEQTLNIAYNAQSPLINGMKWGAAVASGLLDGAIIRRDRFFAQSFFTPWIGGAPMFLGRVSTIDQIGRQDIQIKVKSYLVLGDINMPREVTQPSCRNTLFDSRCKLIKSGFAVAGSVGSISDTTIHWTGATADLALGTIEMESGPSAGQTRTIKSVVPGVSLTVMYPFLFEPAPGDIFSAFPGCDKSIARCTALSNLVNHTGFPFVPPPETAV